jgi:RNA polymerase sigma factor (sigma-70 family)
MNTIGHDLKLLEDYARQNSEAAFDALVRRYIDLVYSAALRQVRSPQLAEEVTQSVFTDLSKNALRLKPDTMLTSWLYQVTRRTAIDVVRRESRRQSREQTAFEMSVMNTNDPAWPQIEPMLEEAMESLDESDRNAILLRFFDNKSLREVGQYLGTSEDAAQKRVSRAVEQLRQFYSKRGVAAGAVSLAALLSANAVQSAPIGLGTAIAATLTAVPHSLAIATTKTLLMTTIQKTVAGVCLAAAVGTALYATLGVSAAHNRITVMEKHEATLTEQLQQMAQERDAATASLGVAQEANETFRRDAPEMIKLRGEVARLRNENRDLSKARSDASSTDPDPATEAALRTWAVRATQLKQRLAQRPDLAIPELQLIKEKDWFDAVKNANRLETDEDFRQALRDLRHNAKSEFASLLQEAMRGYLKSSDNILPTDLSQLKPYFSTPVGDATLQRYSLLESGPISNLPEHQRLVAETAPPVDDEYDTVFRIGVNGTDSSSVNRFEDSIKQAGIQYAEAHGGILPTEASQLGPYLKQPADPGRIQQLLSRIPPGITTLDQLNTSGLLRK